MTRARPLLPLFRRQKRRPPRRPPALRRPSPSAHRRAASLEENTGAGTTGMCVKACSKIEVHDIRVKGVHCDAQNAVGVQYMHIDANEIPRQEPVVQDRGMQHGREERPERRVFNRRASPLQLRRKVSFLAL